MRLSRTLTLLCSAGALLAADWLTGQVGVPSAGSAVTATDSTVTITGGNSRPFFAGNDWSGTFAHQAVRGDFRLTARLRRSLVPGAMAGLMVRSSLELGSATRLIGFDAEANAVRGLKRYADGTTNWAYSPVPLGAEDLWLRFERHGAMVVATCSANGMDWKILWPGAQNSTERPDWTFVEDELLIGMAVMGGGATSAVEVPFDQVTLERNPPIDVPGSWIGNSEGATPMWVQNHVAGMAVAPDGTVYTVLEWDEGGREFGVYRNGAVVGRLAGNFHDGKHHSAVAYADGQVIIGGEFEGQGIGLRRFDPTGTEVGWPGGTNFLALPGLNGAAAISVSGDRIAVADMSFFPDDVAGNRVVLYQLDGAELRELGRWSVERLGRLALGADGDVWALQGGSMADGQRRVLGGASPEKPRCFTGRGLASSALTTPGTVLRLRAGEADPVATIAIPDSDPTAVAVTADGKRLYVADNGPAQRIRIYEIAATTAKPAGFLGTEGGVYAGARPGAQGAGRLPANIVGIGFDSAGNVYTAGDGWAWCGADLRCHASDGSERWKLLGLHGVTDMGSFDPADPNVVFSGSEHYHIDWAKPQGKQWTYVGYTLDPFRYPDDMRLAYDHESTTIKHIQGKRFLVVNNMYGDFNAVYRFAADQGDIAIPCAWINSRGGWVAGSPKDPWIWMDRNGDGRRQSDEYVTFTNNYPGASAGLDIDSAGDLWVAGMRVQRFPFAGFDAHGAPTWQPTPIETARPAPFPDLGGNELRQIRSVPEKDQVWLGGWGEGRRNPWNFFGTVGSTLVRYDDWSKGGTPALRIDLPADFIDAMQVAKSMSLAGEYVFTVDLLDARVRIYDGRDGLLVKSFGPGADISGRNGWVDISYGISAVPRADGSFAIAIEDNAQCKMTMYTWDPKRDGKLRAPVVRNEHGALAWEVNERVGSWRVHLATADGKAGTEVARNLRVPYFADQQLLDGTQRYVVVAVNGAGASPASAVVELTARSCGEALTGEPIAANPETTSEAAYAVDGDPATLARCPGKGAWVGLDLGGDGAQLSQVSVLSAPGQGVLLQNAIIQGSNADPTLHRWTTLATVTPIAADAGLTTFAIADPHHWRYVRFVTAVGNDVNLAEWQLHGSR